MSLPSEKSQWQLHPFHGSSHKPRVLSDGPLSLPFYVQSKSRSCQPSLQSIYIQNWPFLSVSTAPIQAQATTLSCGQSFLSAFLSPFLFPHSEDKSDDLKLQTAHVTFLRTCPCCSSHSERKPRNLYTVWTPITCILHSPHLSSVRALLGSEQLFLQKSSHAWVTVTLLLLHGAGTWVAYSSLLSCIF